MADIVGRIAPDARASTSTNDSRLAYSPDFQQAGRRAMKNTALSLLVLGGSAPMARGWRASSTRRPQHDRPPVRAGQHCRGVDRRCRDAARRLPPRFTADPLVLDKWLALIAQAAEPGVLGRISAVLAEKDFPRNNPNRLRAPDDDLGMNNPTQFARADGEGFRRSSRTSPADADPRNPQVAARVLTAFRVWQGYEPGRALAENALKPQGSDAAQPQHGRHPRADAGRLTLRYC